MVFFSKTRGDKLLLIDMESVFVGISTEIESCRVAQLSCKMLQVVLNVIGRCKKRRRPGDTEPF